MAKSWVSFGLGVLAPDRVILSWWWWKFKPLGSWDTFVKISWKKVASIWILLPELHSMPFLKFRARCSNKNQNFCCWWVNTKDAKLFKGTKVRHAIEDALWDMVIMHESCWSPFIFLPIRRIRWNSSTENPSYWQVVCCIWLYHVWQ